MPYAALNIPLLLPQFLMVLFRISGLALTAPLLSSPALPARLKVAFSFTVSLSKKSVWRCLRPKIRCSARLDTL